MNFNNPEDVYSSSDMSGSDDSEGEDEDPDADGVSDDETGTAMSLDVDEGTLQSVAASEDGSTSSSGRLDATLREASQRAGTRGIEFDEFGDMSMEVAEDEITSAMQPWVQKNILERIGSAEMDQENVNPFSPAFQNGVGTHLTDDGQDSEEDMSMDVTRAVGGIMKAHSQSSPMSEGDGTMDVTRAVGGIMKARPQSSPMSEGDGTMDVTRAVGGIMKARPQSSPTSEGDGTMDLTQAVGKITGQKRRRSTTDAGSPGAIMNGTQSKRRRSSMARSSMGEDTMDLTVAMGGIKSIPERRKSLRSRRSSGMVSDASDMTMDMTKAVGGIQKPAPPADVDESFDYNEELSMELTTVLGGINKAANPTITEETESNITPKDHGRFKDAPDLGAKQLLTPILQKEVRGSVEKEKSPSPSKSPRLSQSPVRKQTLLNSSPLKNSHTLTANPSPRESTAINNDDYPELPPLERDPSPIRTPTSSPKRRTSRRNLGSEQPQFEAPIERQQRSSPVKGAARTPEKLNKSQDDSRNIHENIKLMSTPRKETLKNVTPKKQMSPVKPQTPRGRPTPRGSGTVLPSPVRQLSEDLQRIRMDEQQGESIGLQDFLVKARIRFMDLTTTKRRMTTNVPAVRPKSSQEFTSEETTLENAIVAGACTIPELELYQHACHELKRFAKEGKQVIDELEEQTAREQPPLIQAYVHAPPHRKLVLDAQMRDMKTNARLRSKEMWYAWRSQLLEELMMGLGKIGEGLIQDDETISRLEEVVEQELPPLIQRHGQLQQECAELEQGVSATSEDEKKQLDEARHGLTTVNIDLAEKRRLLESLRAQVKEQDSMADHLQASKVEFTAAIQEANRVREACRGVSLEEITALKGEPITHENFHNTTDLT
jgi:kinetochore protein Spc7/SPC105